MSVREGRSVRPVGRGVRRVGIAGAVLAALCTSTFGQAPTGIVTGSVSDPSGATVPKAIVKITAVATSKSEQVTTAEGGSFTFASLPAGTYELRVTADGFQTFVTPDIKVDINRTVRVPVQLLLGGYDMVEVTAAAQRVETGSTSLGETVNEREILDLPLNGRNFTQLGLLQAGVAPLTSGLMVAGGPIKATQAFAVNGQRPESNNYLLDGVRNVDRMDGGYAIKTPVDAIQEFRILTHTASPEYGSASGSTVSVVTRSGGNQAHGSAYYFGRNDIIDARNFFASEVEPLKQHQFGATLGGPIKKNKVFAFGYYEGFRNRQGVTTTTTVPTPEERAGDFSGLVDPSTGNQLINYITGQPIPGNKIPASMFNPASLNVLNYYPLGNTSPSLYTVTVIQQNTVDQGGGRLDWIISEKDQFTARYAASVLSDLNPLSIRGADVPGFPVGDDITTQSATISETHVFSPSVMNSARFAFFRDVFLFDTRYNHDTPRSLGFNYDSTFEPATGPPFFNVNGYASVGNPITGPRNSAQNDFEFYDSVSVIRGTHSMKFGGEFRRTQINISQGIAANGFFVFAPFPTNATFANFLLGYPVVFFQGGGDFSRGLRSFDIGFYAQDEWRVNRKFTLNYGLRYQISSPFAEIRDRLNQFAPGQQSTVYPDALPGVLFPGDPGVAKRIVDIYYKGLMPRVGFAYDPTGRGTTSIRAAYGIFYDPLSNGSSMPMQAAISALPWLQAVQIGPPALNYTDPWNGGPAPFRPGYFPTPATMLTEEAGTRPPYAQDWNLSIQQALPADMLFEARYVGTKGTHLPRFIEANPSVYSPGDTAGTIDQRRIYANCQPNGACDLASIGLVSYSTNSTYHALQVLLSRRFKNGFAFNTSYWFSKTLDYVSSMNVAGSAPRLISGENDIAQNPFDLAAEHGPSLFDARHRWTFNGSWQVPGPHNGRFQRAVLAGWQLNAIATIASGTPFTVYDSRNVSQQGSAPEISGFYGSRPDVVTDPNAGPHTVEQWVNPAAFLRLDPVTQAGQFGNAGRNIVRGPGLSVLDASVLKNFKVTERTTLQFRFEAFNVLNHANFLLPINDMASQNFGRITQAAPPRVFQAGLKLLF
jgi:hypothetical protein